jgi:hypothetical protein
METGRARIHAHSLRKGSKHDSDTSERGRSAGMGRSPYPQQISYLNTSNSLRLVLRTQPRSEVSL